MLKSLAKTALNLHDNYAITYLISKRNAGHSKWANIRHIKGQKDAERGKFFTKLAQYMKVAIKEGGSIDPSKNLKLEQLIEQAKRKNMPASTIQSILKSAQTDKSQCKQYMFDIKGPGGCVILCEIFTDNMHQVKQAMAPILKKHNSKYGDGGIKHLFEQKGIVETNIPDKYPKTEAELLEEATTTAIEVGAEDVKLKNEECLEFLCSPEILYRVETALEKVEHKIMGSSVEYTPMKLQTLKDDELELASSLYEKLEKLPEVVKLYDNIS